MRKYLLIATVAVLLTVSCLFSVSCNGGSKVQPLDKNLGNYDGKTPVKNMSAYDLIMETYENFLQEKNYRREEYFSFDANDGKIASRRTHLIRKITDGRIYNQEIIYGSGLDGGTSANKYYFDGNSAYSLKNTRKKDIIYDKQTGALSVGAWGNFASFNGNVEEENRLMKEKITTYDISSRERLSSKHNDNVYYTDGKYYCTLTIDCSTEVMKTVQKEAFREFIDTLGAKEDGFSVNDTTIDFAIAEINGKMKFCVWRRTEKYSGRHSAVPLKVSCEQTCISYYTYDKGFDITASDLLNLAE